MTNDDQEFSVDPFEKPRPENEKTRRQLEDLHESIDFLIHEIRTPLTAIISSAEFLRENSPSAERQESLLDIIQKEALRINGLLDSFHRFHQQESEAWLAGMTFAAVRVADLLQDAAARFRNASPRHAIHVKVTPGLPPIRGDRMKLDLVLRNLLANAIKYSPDGGTILLSARKDHNCVVVCVRDHGIGIPTENRARIFDRNFRIAGPDSRTMRGSGQGLAIVTRIVEYHRGMLRVKSQPGKGSAFCFTLPNFA